MPILWFAVVLGWLLAGRLLAVPSFTAELAPDTVGAGEVATLKLVFTDLGDVAAPTLPPLTNCTVQYQGAGSQISIINFKRTAAIVHQYALQPTKTGTVAIPAMSVDIGGKTYTSQPLVLRVGQGFDPASVGFLRIFAPRPEVYLGETFPLEIRYYSKWAPARQVPPTLKLDGFVKGRQTVDNLPSETITNEVYSVVRWSLALTAVKAGDLTVGPAEFQTLYTFENRGRRRARGIESLFEPLFGGVEQRQLTFLSDPLTLRVLTPPAAGRPATFNGAVGRFSIEASASPTNVAAGDPVTVRVQISGQGNFDGLRLPDLPSGSGFQLYPGTNSFTEGDPLGLSGAKMFEAVVVPEASGVQTLEWPWLTYWDPAAKAYATDQVRPLQINVRPGASVQAQPVGTLAVPAAARSNVVTGSPPGELALLEDLGPLVPLTPSVVTHGWYWGLLGLPLFLYAALVLAPVVRRHQAEDPKQAARNRLRRIAAEHESALREHAGHDRAPEFFGALNSALQDQLALTLGGPAGSFTEEVVEARLVPGGLKPEDAAHLRGLFGRLAEARFAPVAAGGELVQLQQIAESVLAALRGLKEAE